MRLFRLLEAIAQDIKYGFRMLVKNPSFTTVAVLSLALGIGACTAIFSIVDAVLLRSLPYPDADRIVQLREVSEKGTQMPFAEPNYLDLRARSQSFEALAQYSSWNATVLGGNQPARANVARASGDFFNVLGVRPALGRTFTPEDASAGNKTLAVVSYGFWQRLLNGNKDLSDTTLKIDDQTYSVIGVMPPSFNFPDKAEVWTQREMLASQVSRTAHNWSVIARVRNQLPLEQAQSDASAIGKQLKQEFGRNMDAVDFAVVPLQEFMVGGARQGLMIVLAAVGFLLLVACTNVANLLLARVTARQKEFAVRAALGASRIRLARQFITENLLLALIAAALGVMLSFWGVDLLVGLNERALPRAGEISVDARALIFTLALSLVIATLLGFVPVMRLSSKDLHARLKEAGRGQSEHGANKRLRNLLVVAQVAFTLILLVGAGLLIKSFMRLLEVDPGFRTESAVVMDLSLPPANDPEAGRRLGEVFKAFSEGRTDLPEVIMDAPRMRRIAIFYQQLLDRISRTPGVTATGGVSKLPMSSGGANGTFLIENSATKTGYADYRQASQGYFAAMGIPLIRGRLFEPADAPDAPPVAVISQSLARKVWPDEDPIGKRIQFGNMDSDTRLITIVGIVGDVRDSGLDRDIAQTVYVHAMQRPQSSSLSIVARTTGDAGPLMTVMRRAVEELNPELPMNFRTIEGIYSSSLDPRRFSLVIFAVFAAVAIILAAIGIYGVISYSVTHRTPEIGIRMALGAQAGDVLRLIIGQGMRLTIVGVALGFAASFALSRLMASLLFGVSHTDAAVFALTGLVMIVVALLACYIPGRRATKVDPITALRYE